VAMLNLLRLGRLTADAELERRAEQIEASFAARVRRALSAHTQLMIGVDFRLGPSTEVVIVGKRGRADTEALARVVRSGFRPRTVTLLRPAGDAGRDVAKLAPFTEHMKEVDGRAAAHVCREHACERPVADPNDLEESLREKDRGGEPNEAE